ncbi:MAG: ABC transporter permease [Bacilli bacterium]|nr:ABC transporter permease [Bacilli bacterium]
MEETRNIESTNAGLQKIAKKEKVKKWSALTFVWLMLLVMYLPIMYLVLYSFTDATIIGKWSGFSLDCYTTLFSPNNKSAMDIWNATWNTVWVALVASLISTILGTTGAIGMHYLGKKLKAVFNFSTQIPIVNAEIVMALSLCILFLSVGLEKNAFTLIIGHVVLTIPFVVINVQPRLESMDPSLYEAAMDLGASRTGALFKVMVPDLLPGILSGFMISMTLSLDDYVITEFTKPSAGDFQTISTYVQGKLAKGSIPIQIRSYTAIIMVLIVAAMVAYTIVNIRKAKKKA